MPCAAVGASSVPKVDRETTSPPPTKTPENTFRSLSLNTGIYKDTAEK